MSQMGGQLIRRKFLECLEAKGHAVIPSAALVPENDPTTLFTGSGMQPLVPYLMGEAHPKGVRLANAQKCFRAEDIDEVGDNRHTTFFEMLGNWSLGDYFKREQLRFFFTFLVDEVGLDPERIYVTVFAGDEALGIPRDDESVAIWQELFAERGIEAKDVFIGSEEEGYEKGMQDGRIFYYDAGKNWWSRSGRPAKMPIGEIGGPDSEVFYDFGSEYATDPAYKDLATHPNSDSGQFVEIGNSVFIEYVKEADGSFSKLPQRNVDFGGGLERIAAAAAGNPDVFLIDLIEPVIEALTKASGKRYEENQKAFRVIADHLRGTVFMIGDGVKPSNSEQGYFTRRLVRRAVRFGDLIGLKEGHLGELADIVIKTYSEAYKNLDEMAAKIKQTICDEEEKFRRTLVRGLKKFEKMAAHVTDGKSVISGKEAFDLFTTYGFPVELTEEMAAEKGLTIDKDSFNALMEEHRARSRSGAEQKFKGGLADHSEKTVQYHTTTHLLLAGLRKVLGDHVHQAGSNITADRLRFDFTHEAKLTPEEITAVEEYVNKALEVGGTVSIETLSKDKAEADPTVEGSFWDRYPDEVKVYTVTGNDGTVFSRELCGGPHVGNLSEVAGRFKITKEESSAAGIRRVKAVVD